MTKHAQQKHAEMIERLASRVRSQYSILQTEVPINDPTTGKTVGEMDLVGLVDGMIDVYEVKTNDDRSKARKQLFNIRRYLENQGYTCPINLYYYSGRNRELTKID